jgi:large subunit ribosomal protein L9
MEVVFTQDIPNKAKAGEIRRVPDGYARNYLLPKGLADIATPEVKKRIHKITAAGDEIRVRETAIMEELAKGLEDVTITISARITPIGRYYGSITSTHIAMELAEQLGREVERRWVEINEPIREPGEYDVVLRLSTEVTATIHVNAQVEE